MEDVIVIDDSTDEDSEEVRFCIQKVPGDGHCIAWCFSQKFNLTIKDTLHKLEAEFKNNISLYMHFSDDKSDAQLLKEINE